MDTNVLSDEKKEAICKAIGTILYNTNKSIYKWNKLAADNKSYTYGPTEVRSLVHGNITRELRFILGEAITRRMFKAGRVFIHQEPENGFISEIVMPQLPSWMSETIAHTFVKEAFRISDYKLCYYDPSKDIDSRLIFSSQSDDFNPTINLDLSKLNSFKF